MGVIRAKQPIVDADIPAAIARDAETAAAIAAHIAAVRPHPYLTQAEGDARYLPLLFKEITFNSGSVEGSLASMDHGLDAAKIMGFSAVLRVTLQGKPVLIIPGSSNSTSLAGCSYGVFLGTNLVSIQNHPTDSENILSKPVTVSFFYKP